MAKRYVTPTVLLIEDERDIQHFICRVLELEGYRVIKTCEGNTGLDMLVSNSVDLVLLDLCLPDLDGFSVLREIKNSPEFSPIPVVVITAVAGSAQRQKSARLGAVRHLVKPLSAHRLYKTISTVLEKENGPIISC
ncbi:MAG: hypothetical protein A2Y89_00320 [Chloroflexi bacterium RBG_13_51_18]|nr:MAG: hypothetical protein A2Y89_00320 [Chloroflexi bacterium RBG_13_51_18]